MNRPMLAPDQVAGLVLRTVLLATQETSGPQYPHLLRAAGLSRFIDALPEPNWAPAATKAEVERLYATVYEMLGEPVTRLFMRNHGQKVAAQLLANPEIQAFLTRAATLPPEQRLGAFLQDFAPFTSRGWTPMRLTQDEQHWYLELEHCPSCAGIHGATAPLCQGQSIMYATLAKAAVGRAVPVTEITCAAAGDSHCKFAVTR
jgi:hypothetical protein